MLTRAICLLCLLCASSMGQQTFIDDFSDGLWDDSDPVRWFLETDTSMVSVVDGDLLLSSNSGTGLLSTIGMNAVSIRAQLRSSGAPTGLQLQQFAQGAFLFPDGRISIGGGGPSVITDLKPLSKDVVLQVDVFDETMNVWAWHADESPATQPVLSLTPQTVPAGPTDGRIWFGEGSSSTAFRYVMFSDQPITVPEPNGATLATLVLLAVSRISRQRRIVVH